MVFPFERPGGGQEPVLIRMMQDSMGSSGFEITQMLDENEAMEGQEEVWEFQSAPSPEIH